MSSIQVIPFGQADCFLVILDCREGKKHVLIDGGTRKHQKNHLKEFLVKNNILNIDFLVLTHLHQDHIGFLPEITRKFGVEAALLPFEAKWWKSFMLNTFEMKQDFFHLMKIRKNLEKKKTQIFYNHCISEYQSFLMGDYCLTVIFPNRKDSLPFTEMMTKKGVVKRSRMEENRKLINGESSVLLLTRERKQIALFCGDCFEENFKKAYFQYIEDKELEEGVQVLKLSHHGRNDKGHIYFTKEFMERIHPKEIIITSDQGHIGKYGEEWRMLFYGCDIHIAESEEMGILIDE